MNGAHLIALVKPAADPNPQPSTHERLRRALAAADAVAWEWDVASGECCLSVGTTVLRGLGGFTDPASVIHPEDRDWFQAAVLRAARGEVPYDFQFRIIADGRVEWVHDRGRLHCDDQGRPMRISGLARLVTQAPTASQPRLPRSLAAHPIAQDIQAVGRIEAVPILLNVLCEITGMRFAAVARVTEDSWTACAVKDDIDFGLQPGGQLDVHTTLCIEVRDTRSPIVIDHASQDPRYCTHPTPKLYQIESYISVPIVLGNGDYFGSLCAIDPAPANVSNPRILSLFQQFAALIAVQLDLELSRKQDQAALLDARAAAELREQFIAILGHDLRNPLHALSATGELLERRLVDPALRALTTRIQANARRMSALIEDILDLARSRLGQGLALRLAEVPDVESALAIVVQELRDAKPGRQIVFDARTRTTVRCDIGRLQQVLSNLIANAIAYGGADSPVRVSMNADAAGLSLAVWNGGNPIPPESIGKIFEPFWRQSTDAHREGLGLGLYICA